jgi:hypothetical protein
MAVGIERGWADSLKLAFAGIAWKYKAVLLYPRGSRCSSRDFASRAGSRVPWTRNLIISSSFGPNLSDKFQGALPSFKDSYQMSAFVATLSAVGNPTNLEKTQDYLSYEPNKQRIFEIEQSGFLHALP